MDTEPTTKEIAAHTNEMGGCIHEWVLHTVHCEPWTQYVCRFCPQAKYVENSW